ncbi:MAG: heme exporter protein CcmB [Spirochaetes bacterium]|nr:heme exporter protein CcmB [Spirochaetota bacterium]
MIKAILRNIVKDIQIDFRSRIVISLILSFSVIVTVSIGFASGGIAGTPVVHSILLWVIIFFSGMNTLSHIFYREIEEGTALFNLMYYSAEIIFVSKLLINCIVMVAVAIVTGLLYLFVMDVFVFNVRDFALVLLTGSVALAVCTTIIAAITAIAQARGGLFTILSFPITLPIITVVIKTTSQCFSKVIFSSYSAILFLLAFSVLLGVVSYMLFPHIWRQF